MRNFRLRALTYGAIILLGLAAALPSLLPGSLSSQLPDVWADHKVTLGLDLRGGSHLLLNVDLESLTEERFHQLAEDLVQRLRADGVASSRPVAEGDRTVINLRSADQVDQARSLALELQAEQSPAWVRFDLNGTRLTLTRTPAFTKALTEDAVERSLEVVRRRLNETGVVEPLISRQGEQGILVQLPGVADPGRVKELLGRTARLTFHLVLDADSSTSGIRVADDKGGPSYHLTRAPLLDGGDLTGADLGFDDVTGEPVVNFRLSASGGDRFADITQANVGRPFAVVLDERVITAPVIRTPITGGAGQISGGFDVAEAQDLALLLRAGALPAPLDVVEERTVGPDLGSDAIAMGVVTGTLGALLVLGFMVVVYGRWGLIANAALLLNAGLVIGVLATLGATLTLPGIAGLILTLGMAVDANILINERIREESRRGSSARYALHTGFQRAFSTILDSNVTTLIAVSLLFMFGSGPVRGFAVAIAVGLLVSMFTSISLTRLLMEACVARMGDRPLMVESGWKQRFGASRAIDFMSVRSRGLVLSLVLSALSIGLLFYPGVRQGIDFEGGLVMEVRTGQAMSIEQLRSGLGEQGVHQVAIQAFGGDSSYLLRLPVAAASGPEAVTPEDLKAALTEIAPQAEFPRVELVGPSVSAQFLETSLLAVLLAGVGMFAYLWFRFEQHFATGAMLTLALDLTKTLGFFVVAGVEFNLTAIAALLALIGYSVNDKVVVFDRIREALKQDPDRSLPELINESLNATLTRTLFTSITTFLAILPMAIAGGEAVASFALPMLFGIVVGTSSSIFIAAPIVMMLGQRAQRRKLAQEALGEPAEVSLFLREDRP
ncbi:MAG: protein translocase subunit SecD [Marinobacter sp.]|uniref:protein translocase subunit SecD n=1 Tax=Marinobacter sp. TaxID=50741 RepID=UPI00299E2563|nr:protein translocase subunit SecD [Marinobacter sp.]MDX1634389.1 protein translocase subunit SecD [Marinobacter sp.]